MKLFTRVFFLVCAITVVHSHRMFGDEQSTSNHWAVRVFSLNATDIPSNFKNEPMHRILTCVSSELQDIMASCANANNANHGIRRGHIRPHFRSVAAMDACVLSKMGANDTEGKVNMEQLQIGLIGNSSLTTEQKDAATASLTSCMNSTFSLPGVAQGSGHGGFRKDIQMPNITISMDESNKAIFCSIKALLQNGCAKTSRQESIVAVSTTENFMTHIKEGFKAFVDQIPLPSFMEKTPQNEDLSEAMSSAQSAFSTVFKKLVANDGV